MVLSSRLYYPVRTPLQLDLVQSMRQAAGTSLWRPHE